MNDFAQGWLASDNADEDKIRVKRIYIDINEGNLYDGVLFSQIMYWHGNDKHGNPRMKVVKDGQRWLAKAYEDWWEECRINANTARKCIARMVERGLLNKKVWHFSGKPLVHIQVNWNKFEELVKSKRPLVSDKQESKRPLVSDRTPVNDTTGQIEPSYMSLEDDCYTDTTSSTDTTKNKEHFAQALENNTSTSPRTNDKETINAKEEPSKSTRKSKTQKQAAAEEDSQRSRDIVAIIKATLDSGVIDPKAYANKTKRDIAAAILDAGITPEEVREYITHLKQEKYWSDKGVTIFKVQENVGAWVQAHRAAEERRLSLMHPSERYPSDEPTYSEPPQWVLDKLGAKVDTTLSPPKTERMIEEEEYKRQIEEEHARLWAEAKELLG